jgi:uroporphyrin-III C-methyltransferase/precorrin-2 dehydrogenase/sirohydrochlorin ferrochelatase
MMALLPLFLKLEGRDVLVIGAGAVAARKIADLVAAGARVRVVAPKATPAIEALAASGVVTWSARAFAEADLDGAWLVVAATSDADAQRRAAEAATSRRVFIVAVDDIPNASAYSGAVIRRDPFLIAISSSGEAPALTRLLRQVLEQALPDSEWIEAARALREKWKADATPMGSRFGELVQAFKYEASKPKP